MYIVNRLFIKFTLYYKINKTNYTKITSKNYNLKQTTLTLTIYFYLKTNTPLKNNT